MSSSRCLLHAWNDLDVMSAFEQTRSGTNGFKKMKKTQSKFGVSVDAMEQKQGSMRRLSSGVPSLK